MISIKSEEFLWPWFLVLDDNPTYKVRRLVVAPGIRLSYQCSNGCIEAWILFKRVLADTLDELEKK